MKGIALLRAQTSDALRSHMRVPRKTETAGIFHTNNARAFIRALTVSTALKLSIKRLRICQLIGVFTAFLLLLIFALTKQMDAANNLIFIALELIMMAVTYTAVKA